MKPQIYRIVITGHLSERFADGLEGTTQHIAGPDTVLEGDFIDQSHLHGLLAQLSALGLEVTRFETVPARHLSDDGPVSEQ